MNSTLSPVEYHLSTDSMRASMELCKPTYCGSDAMFTQPSRTWQDEDAWIVQAKHGEQDAFVQLYDRYYIRIYRYISCRVKRVQDVEDLTQQVFL